MTPLNHTVLSCILELDSEPHHIVTIRAQSITRIYCSKTRCNFEEIHTDADQADINATGHLMIED
jgi:hypothetical protein